MWLGSSLWDCVSQHPSSPAFLCAWSQSRGVMADASPLLQTLEGGGAQGQRLGAQGQCWESQGPHWEQETPAGGGGARRTRPLCCRRDCERPAQNNSLRFTVSGSLAVHSLWRTYQPCLQKGLRKPSWPLARRAGGGSGGALSPDPARRPQPRSLCLLQAPSLLREHMRWIFSCQVLSAPSIWRG